MTSPTLNGKTLSTLAFLVTILSITSYANNHLISQISIQSIFSNRGLFFILLGSENVTYPLIASSPLPEKSSKLYHHMGTLDVVEKKKDRFLFLVPNAFSLSTYSLFFPDIQMETETQTLTEMIRHLNIFASNANPCRQSKDILSDISETIPIYPSISSSFYCYRNLEGIYMTMDYLQLRYPDLVEVIEIGPSYLKTIEQGGHELQAIKLSKQHPLTREIETQKPPLFVLCGIHSRELSSTEACARFAEDILDQYGKDADKTWILDQTEIHMILQSNPDGREDEEAQLALSKHNYYRRKNMHDCETCTPCFKDNGSKFGVDLNRNFPHSAWGTAGITGRCGGNYPGTHPASEPETQAIVNYIQSVLPPGTNPVDAITGAYSMNSKGVLIDVHAFGQDFFWPYAYSDSATQPNDRDHKVLAEKMASFTTPRYDTSNGGYLTSGDTTDWAYATIGVASYTAELGTKFYQTCGKFESNVERNLKNILLYAARISQAPYKLPKGPDIMSISLSSTIVTNSEDLQITINASNERSGTITGAGVRSILLFIDDHPYVSDPLHEYNVTPGMENFVFSVPTLFLSAGQHTIFAQARSTEAIGPVSAAFFEIVEIVN